MFFFCKMKWSVTHWALLSGQQAKNVAQHCIIEHIWTMNQTWLILFDLLPNLQCLGVAGLLHDAAAGIAVEGVCSDIMLSLRILTLSLAAGYPGAPGLLVLQRIVTRSFPKIFEKSFLLRRFHCIRTCTKN